MKTLSYTLPSLLLASTLVAQGGLTTATGYAVEADAGNGVVQGVPAATSIPLTGLQIRAEDGISAPSRPAAVATTHVNWSPLAAGTSSASVHVAEGGHAQPVNVHPTTAGTSDDPQQGGQAPHGLTWNVPAQSGAVAVVTLDWTADATNGAFTSVQVDVDGDGTPDFAHRVSDGTAQQQQQLRVTAGSNGFQLGIVTGAHATTTTSGGAIFGAHYTARLSVDLQLGGGGPQCTFTNFGPECAGRLDGLLPNTPGGGARVGLRLTNAAPHAVAVLAAGQRANTPIPLPLSRCDLLVNPDVTLTGRTGSQGTAMWSFPASLLRPGLHADFQVVTMAPLGGVGLGSSNGTALVCR